MMPSEMKRMKQLEEENEKLKMLAADLSLDKLMLQDLISKKMAGSADRREAIAYLKAKYATVNAVPAVC